MTRNSSLLSGWSAFDRCGLSGLSGTAAVDYMSCVAQSAAIDLANMQKPQAEAEVSLAENKLLKLGRGGDA